jgi:hypothetical protein
MWLQKENNLINLDFLTRIKVETCSEYDYSKILFKMTNSDDNFCLRINAAIDDLDILKIFKNIKHLETEYDILELKEFEEYLLESLN